MSRNFNKLTDYGGVVQSNEDHEIYKVEVLNTYKYFMNVSIQGEPVGMESSQMETRRSVRDYIVAVNKQITDRNNKEQHPIPRIEHIFTTNERANIILLTGLE